MPKTATKIAKIRIDSMNIQRRLMNNFRRGFRAAVCGQPARPGLGMWQAGYRQGQIALERAEDIARDAAEFQIETALKELRG